jgi:uncharacterized small protein (DUF1192 family)
MSMTTHEFQPEEVMAFLDGELSAERAAMVAAHVKDCAECARLADDFRQVSQHLGAWETPQAPAQIEDRVTAIVAERFAGNQLTTKHEMSGKRWLGMRIRVWQLAGGAALILVLVLAVSTRRLAIETQQATGLSGPPQSVGQDTPGKLQKGDTLVARSKRESSVGAKLGGVRGLTTITQEPMIARTAGLKLVIEKLELARAEMERILKAHGGYMGQLAVSAESGSARSLTATLRIPANQLEATLAELRTLGRVIEESQSGEEVTQQYVDLMARLSNARATEKRLVEVLQTRTGKVHDVLEVEREIARVREEIERMDAERKTMENLVQFATLTLTLTEEYNAQLNLAPLSTGVRLRNAVVEGYRDVTETILGIALFFLQYGPSLLLWAAILFWPARLVWRRLRGANADSYEALPKIG